MTLRFEEGREIYKAEKRADNARKRSVALKKTCRREEMERIWQPKHDNITPIIPQYVMRSFFDDFRNVSRQAPLHFLPANYVANGLWAQ